MNIERSNIECTVTESGGLHLGQTVRILDEGSTFPSAKLPTATSEVNGVVMTTAAVGDQVTVRLINSGTMSLDVNIVDAGSNPLLPGAFLKLSTAYIGSLDRGTYANSIGIYVGTEDIVTAGITRREVLVYRVIKL